MSNPLLLETVNWETAGMDNVLTIDAFTAAIEQARQLQEEYYLVSEEEAEERFKELLIENGKTHCPGCGRAIDRGDVAWNEGSTEYGTPASMAVIQCQGCDTGIATVYSWYSPIESFTEAVEHILERKDWQ